MSFSRRIRNIARTQLDALKDRLDRVDAEAEASLAEQRAESDARRELADELRDPGPSVRTPEQIARGSVTPRTQPSQGSALPSQAAPTALAGPLAKHYRVLGLDDGADLSDVEGAYARLAARCAPERFQEGSEEQKMSREILSRVEDAYNHLRDALDPTAGRFDKLEF